MLVMSQSMASYPLLECIIESAQFARGEIAFYDEYCELIAEDGLAQRTSPLTIYYSTIEHFRVLRSSCTLRITVPYVLVQRWAAGNGFDSQLVISESSEEKESNDGANEQHHTTNNVSTRHTHHLERNTAPSTKRTCCLLGQLSHEDLLLFMSNIAPILAATRRSNSIHDVRSSSRISVTQPLVLRNAFIDPSPPLEASLAKIDENECDESSVSNVDDREDDEYKHNDEDVVEQREDNNSTNTQNKQSSTEHNYEHEEYHNDINSNDGDSAKYIDSKDKTTSHTNKSKQQEKNYERELEDEQHNNHNEVMEDSLSDQLAHYESMVVMDCNDTYNNNNNNKTLPRRGNAQLERTKCVSRQKEENSFNYNTRTYIANDDDGGVSEKNAIHSASVSLESNSASKQKDNNKDVHQVNETSKKQNKKEKTLQYEQNRKQEKRTEYMLNDNEIKQMDMAYNKSNVNDANIKNTRQLKRRRRQPSIATSKTHTNTNTNTHTGDIVNDNKSITENEKGEVNEEQYNNDTTTNTHVTAKTLDDYANKREVSKQSVNPTVNCTTTRTATNDTTTVAVATTTTKPEEDQYTTVTKSASQHWTARKVNEQSKVNCDISTFMSELLHLIPHSTTKSRTRQTRTAAKRNTTPAERKVKKQKQENMAKNMTQAQEMEKKNEYSGLDAKFTSTHKNVRNKESMVSKTNNNNTALHYNEDEEEHKYHITTNTKNNKSTEVPTSSVVDASTLGLARKSYEPLSKRNSYVVKNVNNAHTTKVFDAVDENNEHEAARYTGGTSTKHKHVKQTSTGKEETIANMHQIDYTPSPMTEAAVGDERAVMTAKATTTATNKQAGSSENVNNREEKTVKKCENCVNSNSNSNNIQANNYTKSNSSSAAQAETKESCRPFPLLLLDDEDVICAQKSRTHSTEADQVSYFQSTPQDIHKHEITANNNITVNRPNANTSLNQKDVSGPSLAVSSLSSFFRSSLLTSKRKKEQERVQQTDPKCDNSSGKYNNKKNGNDNYYNNTNINAPNRKERLRKLLRQVNVMTQSLSVIQECHEQLRELVLDAIDDGDLET